MMNLYCRSRTFVFLSCALGILFLTGSGLAENGSHSHSKMVMTAQKETEDEAVQVRIDERLGQFISLDTVFKDSTGKDVRLEQIFDRPVVLLPIFFSCTSVCSFLQADLAYALNKVGQEPGKDFNVITLSFADDEDADHAADAKKNYTHLITREFDLDNWYYLTGETKNIHRLTDSLGYYFVKKEPHFYIHPSALMVLAKDGKIIRYLYGPNFLPFDLGMAIAEAEKGEPGISIKRGVLSFCFGYDSEKKTYVFNVFRITGTAVLLLLAGFIIFLVYPSKRNTRKKNTNVS